MTRPGKPRHTPSRSELIARLPRALRPRLTRQQITELGLAHSFNWGDIAHGVADEALLWQYVGGVLTWSRVADLLGTGQAEMRAQLEVASALVARYGRTGRVLFTGPELTLARDGVAHMDQLAAIVDQPTAAMAADWSEHQVQRLVAQCGHGVAA